MSIDEEFASGRVVSFTGRVLPERAVVSIYLPPGPVEMDLGGEATTLWVSLSIGVSQISVAVRLLSGAAPDLMTLKNSVEALVSITTDTIGYSTGRGYDVEISAASTPSGEHVVFGIDVPVLTQNLTERPLKPEEVIALAFVNPHLALALAELREAIRSPARTGAHCFAAIEAVRHHFVEALDEAREEGWTRLRDALKVAREYTSGIELAATAQRHGELGFMTDADRADALTRAWRVVDRFCLYAQHGSIATAEVLNS